ncbi:MAG TPA: protein kinase [Candidatus Limnocylindria bacterium]|nr:protein kinase [Candidatus Limnocylindria bacterium]
MIGQTLGHYRIERALGEGGMGLVYVATDLKLERSVALKVIRGALGDLRQRERFWREAKAAAAFNHPNVCHLYEIGEDRGELFIAMELLEGETLAQCLGSGALPVAEAVRIGLEVLSALATLHRRGFVHRDVKPSNVFLLADGRVKLLDFGLVLPGPSEGPVRHEPGLTMTGVVLGSPRYMAPEQVRGETMDGRADLFALAAVLHEAVTGRPVFKGATPVEIMYAVLNDRPSVLAGSPALEALGRVLDRALAKAPAARHPDAETLAAEIRAVTADAGTTSKATAIQRVVRLAVLPFRMLRPDPDREFLSTSLADAIAMSLAGIRSLIVRSTVASSRFAGPSPDLPELARSLEVDAALVGTVVTDDQRCRVAVQLVETPGGEVVWSQTLTADGRDVFQMQDTITRQIVESLQLPLSARERSALGRDVPASATAYELFLRANRLVAIGEDVTVARDLYRQALESDPDYAPAWARLGRCHRVVGKYFASGRDENYRKASEALGRSLELHPDLPSAHYFLAQLELDQGRTRHALDRLLSVVERNPNDPNGYAGLVSAFRYVGLLEESLAAHRRARELDPEVSTSVHYTLASLGRFEDAIAEHPDPFSVVRGWLLAHLGRVPEAIDDLRRSEERERGNLVGWISTLKRAALEGDQAAARRAMAMCEGFPDPEGRCLHASACAKVGEHESAARLIVEAIDGGYANPGFLRNDEWLGPVRDDPKVAAALERADAASREAAVTYGGRLR